jgi:hypothetical protein
VRAASSASGFFTALALLSPSHATGQATAPAYSAHQLNCARFLDINESKILTEAGGRTRRQTSQRRGTWQFRASSAGTDNLLEGWLDSLTITRRSEEAVISPDTDGLVGGRYRGRLSPTGSYTADVHPFVPDEVAEVAGMATALDDFFPRLPSFSLRVGQVWDDSLGLTIKRLPDSVSSGVALQRFDLRRREKAQTATAVRDTMQLEQESNEVGQFVWHPQRGLLRRQRSIVVETTVPPSRSVRQAVRSRVEQRITLVRTSDGVRQAVCGSPAR